MNYQNFEKGIILLTASFPGLNFNPKVFWEMLKDLEDKNFLTGITTLIKDTPEIYPGTNVIALIRTKSNKNNNPLEHQGQCVLDKVQQWEKEQKQ